MGPGFSRAIFESVDLRDVRVIQSGEGLGLALEPQQAVGIGGDRLGQHFERDVTFEPQVARAIDLAHSAFAKLREDLVGAETATDGQCHSNSAGYSTD